METRRTGRNSTNPRQIELPSGARVWQATFESAAAGIRRTRRNFETRKDAAAWLKACRDHETRARLGLNAPARHTFADGLARWMEETGQHLSRAGNNSIVNARRLLWPIPDPDTGEWLCLGDLHIEPVAGERSITGALQLWLTDLKAVRRRVHHGRSTKHTYHQRAESGALVWYWQPDPYDGDRPAPRQRITDPALLAQLDATTGRGPFSTASLRSSQGIAGSVLRAAHESWEWIDHPQAPRIKREPRGANRTEYLTVEQLHDLVIAADDAHLGAAILAAAWTAWRQANILGLTWDRVRWPEHDHTGRLTRPGMIWCDGVGDDGNKTKNSAPLAQPMSDRLHQLLRFAQELRTGDTPHVFTDATGRPWLLPVASRAGQYRFTGMYRYRRALHTAGIPAGFRWHDLRRTAASHWLQAGVDRQALQILGGWKTPAMLEIYARIAESDLLSAVNTTRKTTEGN